MQQDASGKDGKEREEFKCQFTVPAGLRDVIQGRGPTLVSRLGGPVVQPSPHDAPTGNRVVDDLLAYGGECPTAHGERLCSGVVIELLAESLGECLDGGQAPDAEPFDKGTF